MMAVWLAAETERKLRRGKPHFLSLHTKRKEVQPDEGERESSAVDGSVHPDSGSAVRLSLVS